MKKIYACLVGNWVCLNDDPNVRIDDYTDPFIWFEEGGSVYSPFKKDEEDRYDQLDYVNIHYKGKDYRINPIFIQIVTE